MYALGSDFVKDKWMFSTSWSGYSGYKNQRDRPMQLNFEIRHDWEGSAFRIQFIYGLRDYDYETLRISYIWKLNGIK